MPPLSTVLSVYMTQIVSILARLETILVMMTDSTETVAAPAPACRIRHHAAPATDCWLTGSASMGDGRCDDHLAGKDRHN